MGQVPVHDVLGRFSSLLACAEDLEYVDEMLEIEDIPNGKLDSMAVLM